MKETTRPPLYRSMKYWGKKPHNVWRHYMEKYSNPGDIVLDPFAGSGITFFEGSNIGRKTITIDINPLTDLVIKSLSIRSLDVQKVEDTAKHLIALVKSSKEYMEHYMTKCLKCGAETDIYNYKNNVKISYEIAYKCSSCKKTVVEKVSSPNTFLFENNFWYPTTRMSSLLSVSKSFIKGLEKDSISELWTEKNLFFNSFLYDEILKIDDKDIKLILIFSFIQGLHLTSKMCVPRNDSTGRPLSTSWGRPAFMLPKKSFEQNPVFMFEKNVFGPTGTIKAYLSAKKYIRNTESKHIIGDSNVELLNVKEGSVDLVITDPPYSDIIQYGDLSEVWVSWLTKYDERYSIDHDAEVIINSKNTEEDFVMKLSAIFTKIRKCLKQKGKFILTFNSSSERDWVMLFEAISKSNFKIENVSLQRNMRSSEANVAATDGVAITDFYIIAVKSNIGFNVENELNRTGVLKYVKKRR